MPELPEVETIKNDLKKRILGKRITGVEIRGKKVIKNKPADFVKVLKDNSFQTIDRIGKLLIFELADRKNFLLIHLKLTGQLIYCDKGEVIAGGHSLTPSNSPLARGRAKILPFTRGGAPVAAGAEG